MPAITITNLSEVINGIDKLGNKFDKATGFALGIAALEIERQAKLNASTGEHKRGKPHIPGTGPGPNVVSGDLRRSITSEVKKGFKGYVATVGPTVEYARQVELGGRNWKSGVKYPFLEPAARKLVTNGTLNRQFTGAFNRYMGGS